MRTRIESPKLIARPENARGLAHTKTLSRITGRNEIRQVLECASPLALWPIRFFATMPIKSLLLLVLLLCAAGCRRDMFNQPAERPLQRSDFFQDNHMASRPLPPHTIARGHLEEDEAFYTGKVGEKLVTTFPIPITREVLLRGQERFNIYCSPCHGRTGDGNGMIPQRGFPVPPSYHIDRLRQVPVGHFFDVITHGYGVMYSYAARVEPEDRWAIAAYIRVLQLSHDARISDVPEDERAKLEAAK